MIVKSTYTCTWCSHFVLLLLYRFGPLVRHWMMRFEARHLYFKKLANNLGNFKNICLSLTSRYQQLQCYVSINESAIGEPSLEFGPCSIPDIQIFHRLSLSGNDHVIRYAVTACTLMPRNCNALGCHVVIIDFC